VTATCLGVIFGVIFGIYRDTVTSTCLGVIFFQILERVGFFFLIVCYVFVSGDHSTITTLVVDLFQVTFFFLGSGDQVLFRFLFYVFFIIMNSKWLSSYYLTSYLLLLSIMFFCVMATVEGGDGDGLVMGGGI
jgi:hypothetical protein